MKPAIRDFWITIQQEKLSKATLLLDGNAETADSFIMEKKLRKFARYVLIRRLTLKEKLKITKAKL